MSLLARLLLLVVIAVLPAFGILLYNGHDLRAAREAETHAEALRSAHAVADELQRLVEGTRDLLLTIAHAPPVRDGNWSDCNSYLDELGDAYPSYSRLTVADLSGRIVCASEPVPPSHSMAARAYFQEALASGEFTVGTYTIGRRSGDEILPFAAPFRDRNGDIAGVVINGLRLDWLATQVGRKLLPPDGTLLVADRDGTILTRRPDSERWTGQKITGAGSLLEVKEAGTTEKTGLEGIPRIYGYVPARVSPSGLHVVVGIGTARVLEPILMASDRGFVLVGLAGLLALIAGWFGGGRFIRRPIRRLIAASYQLGDGNYRRAALPAAPGDFGALNRAFEAMAKTLANREAALKEALERNQALLREGNHRIKNNLQLVSSLLGLQRGALHDPGARLALLEAKQRIQAIARVHEGFYRAGACDRVDFADYLRTLCESLPGTKGQANIVIDASQACVIPADRATPLALIANELITNAIKHAFAQGQRGAIVVRCAVGPGRSVVLTVEDDGRGLPASFDIGAQGGFGLRLVQTLARQIGAEVRVGRRDPGTVAEIRIAPCVPMAATG